MRKDLGAFPGPQDSPANHTSNRKPRTVPPWSAGPFLSTEAACVAGAGGSRHTVSHDRRHDRNAGSRPALRPVCSASGTPGASCLEHVGPKPGGLGQARAWWPPLPQKRISVPGTEPAGHPPPPVPLPVMAAAEQTLAAVFAFCLFL